MTRTYRAFGIAAPILAASVVLTAGAITPGYNPFMRTISWLAVPAAPAAPAVDFAIVLVAACCFVLAMRIGDHAALGRALLGSAAVGLTVTAIIHLDPATPGTNALHRAVSGIAVVCLAATPLTLVRSYGRLSLIFGIAEATLLTTAPLLLALSFEAWGAWQRVVLGLALTWIVLTAATIPSTEEIPSARAASFNSSGS